MSDVTPWTEPFRVRSYEGDAGGRVTPASLCNYLQEAAGNHAFALDLSVEQLHERGLTWMLARLRLEVKRSPRWRETVFVETWPSGTHGLLAIREFILRDESADEVARASTAWLLIDLQRRRPARLPPDVLALRLPNRPSALAFTGDRVPAPSSPSIEDALRVKWSDVDVNEHVNNVRYIAWAMDSLPAETLRDHELARLSVDFLAETRLDDRLTVRTELTSAGAEVSSVTEVLLEPERKPVARVAGSWRPSMY